MASTEDSRGRNLSPVLFGVAVGVVVMLLLVYGLAAAAGDSAVGTVLGPLPSHPGYVRVDTGSRVVVARDPYPAAMSLAPGTAVELRRDATGMAPGVSVSLEGRVDSVPSDDASAVAAQSARSEERELEDAPFAVRSSLPAKP